MLGLVQACCISAGAKGGGEVPECRDCEGQGERMHWLEALSAKDACEGGRAEKQKDQPSTQDKNQTAHEPAFFAQEARRR